jgi:hypothetical protein
MNPKRVFNMAALTLPVYRLCLCTLLYRYQISTSFISAVYISFHYCHTIVETERNISQRKFLLFVKMNVQMA